MLVGVHKLIDHIAWADPKKKLQKWDPTHEFHALGPIY